MSGNASSGRSNCVINSCSSSRSFSSSRNTRSGSNSIDSGSNSSSSRVIRWIENDSKITEKCSNQKNRWSKHF